MPEESNIRQATPPKGLLTKSLEGASGLSPKQQIARAYEDDLSGKRGPEARFDALNELIGARVSESMDNMVFSSGDGTQIAGKNGFFTAKSATGKGGSSKPEDTKKKIFPWDIIAESTNSYTIYAPKVIFSREDVEQVITITNTTFSLSDGDWIVAKMQGPIATFLETPTITIEKVSTWDGFPSAYKFGATPSYAWETSRIPIHQITGTDQGGSVSIGENLYATRLIGYHPILSFTLAVVPSAVRTRVVPTFL